MCTRSVRRHVSCALYELLESIRIDRVYSRKRICIKLAKVMYRETKDKYFKELIKGLRHNIIIPHEWIKRYFKDA